MVDVGGDNPYLSMSFMAKITHRSRGEPFKELKDAFIPSTAWSKENILPGDGGSRHGPVDSVAHASSGGLKRQSRDEGRKEQRSWERFWQKIWISSSLRVEEGVGLAASPERTR
jgi:hypothetical protein